MMTLEEAIKHAEKKYEEQIEAAEAVKRHHGKFCEGYRKHCQCAEEHKQLADWLKELQELRSYKSWEEFPEEAFY